jgi:hypothetical protein
MNPFGTLLSNYLRLRRGRTGWAVYTGYDLEYHSSTSALRHIPGSDDAAEYGRSRTMSLKTGGPAEPVGQ